MINVALIGYGYWGNNLLRNLTSSKLCNVRTVCDSRLERLEILKDRYPSIKTTQTFQDILDDSTIDAIIIATPVLTHFDLAKAALEKGKHVLVEKPLTTSSREVEELAKLADARKLTLMVDHTFLYGGSVQKIKQLVEDGSLGTLKYFDSTRINLGLIQSDVNVLWDLAPHDLSILLHLKPDWPLNVSATGVTHTANGIETIAYMTLHYADGFMAHFNCSWYSPVKVRTTLIGGDRRMIVYDDVHPTEKVKVYDSGFVFTNDEDKAKSRVDYRNGDIYIPKLSTHEPLQVMLEDFFQAIEKSIEPLSNWKVGRQAVLILEAAQQSLKLKGEQIKL